MSERQRQRDGERRGKAPAAPSTWNSFAKSRHGACKSETHAGGSVLMHAGFRMQAPRP